MVHLTVCFCHFTHVEFIDIQATIECVFTLKRVRDMTKTYSLKMIHDENDVLTDDELVVARNF